MNKKIKVIELLNMIANGKKTPQKFKLITPVLKNEIIFTYSEKYGAYFDEDDNSLPQSLSSNLSNLNSYIEILEDEEEIDIQGIEELVGKVNARINNKTVDAEDLFYTISNIIISLNNSKEKTNQLVKAVKQLDKNKVDYIQPYKEE